jgi:hypothetical protein
VTVTVALSTVIGCTSEVDDLVQAKRMIRQLRGSNLYIVVVGYDPWFKV